MKWKLLLFAMLSFLLIPIHVCADAADEDKGLEDNLTFHIYDDVDLISTLKFDYGKPRIIIKSVYPQLASETDKESITRFNELAKNVVLDEINQFKNLVKGYAPIQSTLAKSQIINNLYIDYDTSYVKAHRDHILSIRFSIKGEVAKMPYLYRHHRVLNYSLDNGEEINLSDLFINGSDYLTTLSTYANQVLSRRFQGQNLIAQGIAPQGDNFTIWNIKSNGLLFTFENSKVASSIHGTQTVLIPYSVLKTIAAEDSPIEYCTMHPKKCARSHLLTGGFIDEAVNSKHSAFNPILS